MMALRLRCMGRRTGFPPFGLTARAPPTDPLGVARISDDLRPTTACLHIGERLSVSIYDFFEAILGDQEGWVVCGLMDQAGPKGQLNRQHDFYYPDNLADMVEWAESHQNEDAYCSPLIYGDMRKKNRDGSDGNIRRIPENAKSCLVVYQDSDTCPPEKFRCAPSVHVDSSAGKGQDYWILTEPVSAERAADASRRIAIAHRQDGSDPSSWSANKYLRIPNTTNTRHGFPERVIGRLTGELYDIEEIEAKYSDITFEEKPVMRLPADVSYDDVQDLPEYGDAMAKLPGTFKMSLLTDEPSPTQDRSTLRYRLLCDLFRTGVLTFEEVLAVAWHAPASRKWREDPRNLRGLIAEAIKAQTDVSYSDGTAVSQVDDKELIVGEVKAAPRERVFILSEEERTLAAGEQDFIKRYQAWSRDKLESAFNAPYARMNAWSVLTAAFSDFGRIPSTGDSCNMFMMGLGDSGSGKSAARRLWKRVLHEIFEHDSGWLLGSNASPVALHEKLIERDGKVSFFSADEAHGWFKATNSQQWADGIYEAIAEYYNGDVPPILRASQGRREMSGKGASTHFNIHMMGTEKGEHSLPSVLNRSMFFSGFLARFVWYIGDEKVVNEETLRETNGDGEHATYGYEQQARQWAAEFANTKKILKARTGKSVVALNASQAALDRLTMFKVQLRDMAMKRAEWDILEPSTIRLSESVRKAASLLALEDGRSEVEYRDVVVALESAEEWVENLFYVAEKISASAWAREVDEIEAFVIAKGGMVGREVVMKKFAARHLRDLLTQLDALHAQGRVVEAEDKGKKYFKVVA